MLRPGQTAKSAQNAVLHLQKLQNFSHIINLYLSDKPIPTTTTILPFARKPIFAIAIAATHPLWI